jgi:hypothetical protein
MFIRSSWSGSASSLVNPAGTYLRAATALDQGTEQLTADPCKDKGYYGNQNNFQNLQTNIYNFHKEVIFLSCL